MKFKEFKDRGWASKENKIGTSGVVYRWERRISIVLSWFLFRCWPSLLPNHVSAVNLSLVLIVLLFSGVVAVSNIAPVVAVLFQLVLLFFSAVLDKVDGELARAHNHFTQRGIYFDQAYHFFYPLALFIPVAHFFSFMTGESALLLLGIFFSILVLFYKSFGKLRHHIGFKIKLENHLDQIRDWQKPNQHMSLSAPWSRTVNCLVFSIYDYLWVFYVVLVILSVWLPVWSFWVYISHLVLSTGLVIWRIFNVLPKQGLFNREELSL
ncbi:MAG: CDP-alcohol phosphatidyltransferase family protein [Patescibacteria group bacterium]